MRFSDIIYDQAQSPVVIKKKNNCAKVAKTVARKVIKGTLLPVGTLVGVAAGTVQGVTCGFLAGYFAAAPVVGYENYDLNIRSIVEGNPSLAAMFSAWVLGQGGMVMIAGINVFLGPYYAAPELGKLGYNVTNKAIDHVFGKYKSTDSSQNKDSLNTPISQNVESKSQKTKGELDQNDIKENAAIKIQSFVRSVQSQRKQDISVRKIQAFVKLKISKTSKVSSALNVS